MATPVVVQVHVRPATGSFHTPSIIITVLDEMRSQSAVVRAKEKQQRLRPPIAKLTT